MLIGEAHRYLRRKRLAQHLFDVAAQQRKQLALRRLLYQPVIQLGVEPPGGSDPVDLVDFRRSAF